MAIFSSSFETKWVPKQTVRETAALDSRVTIPEHFGNRVSENISNRSVTLVLWVRDTYSKQNSKILGTFLDQNNQN